MFPEGGAFAETCTGVGRRPETCCPAWVAGTAAVDAGVVGLGVVGADGGIARGGAVAAVAAPTTKSLPGVTPWSGSPGQKRATWPGFRHLWQRPSASTLCRSGPTSGGRNPRGGSGLEAGVGAAEYCIVTRWGMTAAIGVMGAMGALQEMATAVRSTDPPRRPRAVASSATLSRCPAKRRAACIIKDRRCIARASPTSGIGAAY